MEETDTGKWETGHVDGPDLGGNRVGWCGRLLALLNHLPALEMALIMRPDVVFFLTDASEPQMSAIELARVRRLNRGTVINTIEFGAGPRGANYNFLQALAAENGGQHGYVDVGRLLR